ncbi:MAG: hypothetical protein HYX97_00160, partial [Chloroflexi bacterium]|nr:hypothetical protein [Chloroflexota bacterium]
MFSAEGNNNVSNQPTGNDSNQDRPVGQAIIKVIGCGGGGANAVSRMYRDKVHGAQFICINTDAMALMKT